MKQDPPKWLTTPVKLNPESQFKVYDFTEGSLNNELRKTNDTDVVYEFEAVDDPHLKHSNIDTLESKIKTKQEKRIKRFEKEEEKRMEDAKRSGSIVEGRSKQSNF